MADELWNTRRETNAHLSRRWTRALRPLNRSSTGSQVTSLEERFAQLEEEI